MMFQSVHNRTASVRTQKTDTNNVLQRLGIGHKTQNQRHTFFTCHYQNQAFLASPRKIKHYQNLLFPWVGKHNSMHYFLEGSHTLRLGIEYCGKC